MANARESISTSPHSDSHLRVVLDRLRRTSQTAAGTISPGAWTANGAIAEGEPVYVVSNGVLAPANAGAISTSRVIGFARESAITGATLIVQTAGLFAYSGWSLTANTKYYLDIVAGGITATAPSVYGECVVNLGYASNTTELVLLITPPLLL
jgi:hypothetical protein